MYNAQMNFFSPVLLIFSTIAYADVEFVAYGDWGFDSPALFEVVRAVEEYSPERKFVLLLGDNFYPKGVSSIRDPLFNIFTDIVARETTIPYYPILGNHDVAGKPDVQIQYSGVDSRWDFPSRYYKRIYTKDDVTICLIMMDTNRANSTQMAWIDEQLGTLECNSKTSWPIISGHYPIYSSGIYTDEDFLKQNLVPILHKYDVPLYLCGHEHLHAIFYDEHLTQITSGATAMLRSLVTFKENEHQIWGVSGPKIDGFLRFKASKSKIQVDIVSAKTLKTFQSFEITRGGSKKSMFGDINWNRADSNKDVIIAEGGTKQGSSHYYLTSIVATTILIVFCIY